MTQLKAAFVLSLQVPFEIDRTASPISVYISQQNMKLFKDAIPSYLLDSYYKPNVAIAF